MKDRIKKLRKTLGMTQEVFAECVGLKSNTVACYETGVREPSNASVRSVCREFNVNEHWLRTGEGEMFVEESHPQTINERIAEVVKATGKTKTAFAESLGVSQQYISRLERIGNPSDRTIRDICEKYSVNEYWLRTGEGEMFQKRSSGEAISSLFAAVYDNPNSFQAKVVSMIAEISSAQWKLLEQKALELLDEMQKEKAGQ